MTRENIAQQALATMLEKDCFTAWLGIIIDEHGEGYCKLHFTVRSEMLNGFGIVHGGVLFSAADSAFAFACNSYGRLSVALDATINFLKPAAEGDIVTAEARELHCGNRTGFYDVILKNSRNEQLALFRGTAYRTDRLLVTE